MNLLIILSRGGFIPGSEEQKWHQEIEWNEIEENKVIGDYLKGVEIMFIASLVYLTIITYAVVSIATALPTSFDQTIQSTGKIDKTRHGSQAGLIPTQDLASDKLTELIDTRTENAKVKREEEETLGGDGGGNEEEGEDEEEEEGEILPIRQHENVLRVSDLRPQLRDFMNYNSPDLLGPDSFYSDLSDEEIELERLYYYEMLRNEFEELADFPPDDVSRLRAETLRQVRNILLLERQFGLEIRGRQEEEQGSEDIEKMPAPADTDKLSTWLDSAATDPPTASFSSSMLPAPNPSRLWTTIWELIRQEYWEFEYADVGIPLSPTLVLAVTNEMYDVPEADQAMLTSVITATIEVVGRLLPEPPR